VTAKTDTLAGLPGIPPTPDRDGADLL